MDGGATCEVSLWYIPDPLDQDYADEIGSVRYVPCDANAISKCVGYLVDSCDDSQAHSFAYWDLPR